MHSTVERIHRLLVEAALPFHYEDKDKDGSFIFKRLHTRAKFDSFKKTLGRKDLVEDALEDALGVRVGDFCEMFGLVSKLDYALSFFRAVVEYALHTKQQPDVLVATVTAVLRRITDTFGGLVTQGHRPNAIGVGFENLLALSEDVAKKRQQIIRLLFEKPDRGLRWLIDDIAGWQIVA